MHVLSTRQFLDTKVLEELFALATEMEKQDAARKLPPALAGKILATLFYEPSTRTRLSFESAALKLGGGVISTESAGHFSSAVKGESLGDSIRIVSGYADVIALRHPQEGAAAEAAAYTEVPLINAGDGSGEHPTQALLDVYTIQKELGRVDGLQVTLVGDLRYGRTVHSLLHLLGVYKDVKIRLVSPPTLALPQEYKEYMQKNGVAFDEEEDLAAAAAEADVLYVTRIQKERFQDQGEYERLRDSYVVDGATLDTMKKDAIILHPLPRVNEISTAVDTDPRAAYFRQAVNGLYIRMALLQKVLTEK